MAGFKFRRQHPIGHYIVDFICFEKKLIIEVDGGQHADNILYDEARTKYLEEKNFTVLRFWNNEVTLNTTEVLNIILNRLERPPSP